MVDAYYRRYPDRPNFILFDLKRYSVTVTASEIRYKDNFYKLALY